MIFREDALIASRAFDQDALSIGRGAENDLALDDGKVSRAHCKIVRARGTVPPNRDLAASGDATYYWLIALPARHARTSSGRPRSCPR